MEKEQIELADLILDVVLSTLAILYASFVICKMNIRLNILTRIRWFIIFVSVLARLVLTIYDYSTNNYDVKGFRMYMLWLIEQAHFMMILMLFFSVIGSWQISSQIRQDNQNEQVTKSIRQRQHIQLHQKKIDLNAMTFKAQFIFGLLTLVITIQTQIINRKIYDKKQNCPLWLLIDQLILCTLLILFYILLGLKASLTLNQTGVKMKWPLFLTIWSICITYVLDGMFQFFIYMNYTFLKKSLNNFNLFEARALATTVHNLMIYLVMFLLIYHTQRINSKTIRLLCILELKRAEIQPYDLNNTNNSIRRTGKSFAAQEQPNGQIGFYEKEDDYNDTRLTTKSFKTTRSEQPEAVELPRKGNNFRVTVERKLGIDWEHTLPQENQLASSVQTNDLQDGYDELQTPTDQGDYLNSLVSPKEIPLENKDKQKDNYDVFQKITNTSFKMTGGQRAELLKHLGQQSFLNQEIENELQKQQVIESLFLDRDRPYKFN